MEDQRTQPPVGPDGPQEAPPGGAQEEPKSEVKRLNPVGLLAGGAAAATVSVISGYLGAVGTVVGAFLTSVVSATAFAIYNDSLDKGKKALRKVKEHAVVPGHEGAGARGSSRTGHTAQPASAAGDPEEDVEGKEGTRSRVPRILLMAVGMAVIGFAAVFGIQHITGFELSPGTGTVQRSVTGNEDITPRGGTDTEDGDRTQDTDGTTDQQDDGQGQDDGTGDTDAPSQDQPPQDDGGGDGGGQGDGGQGGDDQGGGQGGE